MRSVILIFVLFTLMGCNKKIVSFTTILKKENATKEGIYLDGYVVDIKYDSILILDRKKIKVTGKYIIIEGLKKKDSVTRQGRYSDTKHIINPKIEIINE